MESRYNYIIFFLIIVFIFVIIFVYTKKINKNKLFYDVNEIDKNLIHIDIIKENILHEVMSLQENTTNTNNWKEWPEKYLYCDSSPDSWKIFPFFAFGIWVSDNCNKCPYIYDYIKNIPKLKLATLSKLKPKTKLNIHQGWASHSNHVIRCHYGIVVPDNLCYIYVQDNTTGKNQKKYHKNFEWLVFDDSKLHYASNESEIERIVLILDIERPTDIEIGKSDIGDSKELIEIINSFKNKNLKHIVK